MSDLLLRSVETPGIKILVIAGDSTLAEERIDTERAEWLGARAGEIPVKVQDFIQDNYSQSYRWILPNIRAAVTRLVTDHQSGPRGYEEIIVPLMSYDGPTGETNRIVISTFDWVRYVQA